MSRLVRLGKDCFPNSQTPSPVMCVLINLKIRNLVQDLSFWASILTADRTSFSDKSSLCRLNAWGRKVLNTLMWSSLSCACLTTSVCRKGDKVCLIWPVASATRTHRILKLSILPRMASNTIDTGAAASSFPFAVANGCMPISSDLRLWTSTSRFASLELLRVFFSCQNAHMFGTVRGCQQLT